MAARQMGILIVAGLVMSATLYCAAQEPATQPATVNDRILHEAQRQDTVNQRIGVLVDQFGELIGDLQSNSLPNKGTETEAKGITDDLKGINDVHVIAAADSLLKALSEAKGSATQLNTADKEVQVILRDLNRLLVRANAAQAKALLLSDLREIITKQESLRGQTAEWGKAVFVEGAKADGKSGDLSAGQTVLVGRTTTFTQNLQAAQKAETDPMAAMRLMGVVRLIVEADPAKQMGDAASSISSSEPVAAVAKQDSVLKVLKDAERMLQGGTEADNIAKLRDELRKILVDQQALRTNIQALRQPDFAKVSNDLVVRQRDLGSRLGACDATVLEAAIGGTTTAPADQAAAAKLSPENPIVMAIGFMGDAEGSIGAQKKELAAASEVKAEDALKRAIELLDKMVAEQGKVDALARQYDEAVARAIELAALEARQRDLLAATVDAGKLNPAQYGVTTQPSDGAASTQPAGMSGTTATAPSTQPMMSGSTQMAMSGSANPGMSGSTQPLGPLAAPQKGLEQKTDQFAKALPKDSQWTPPVQRSLAEATKAQDQAVGAMTKEQAPQAADAQQHAAEALREAKEGAERQAEALGRQLDERREAERNKELAKDLEKLGEQQDRIAAEAKKAEDSKADTKDLGKQEDQLKEAAQNFGQEPSIQAEMKEAQENMDKASQALQANQPKVASPYMKKAAEMIRAAKKKAAGDAETNTDAAEVQQTLEKIDAELYTILQRQRLLRGVTEKTEPVALPAIKGEQDILIAEAQAAGEDPDIIGKEFYEGAQKEMTLGAKSMFEKNRDEAVKHQKAAEKQLEEAEKALQAAAQALAKMGEPEDGEEEPEENGPPHPHGMEALAQTLILAARQRELRLQTRDTEDKAVAKHATAQDKLHTDAEAIIQDAEVGVDLLSEASKEMQSAVKDLKKPDKTIAIDDQVKAEIALRKAIVVMAKEMKAKIQQQEQQRQKRRQQHPPEQSEQPEQPENNPESKEGPRNLQKSPVGGQPPARDKERWNSLGERERAALSQKYANQLPPEYRQLLEEYYDSLSK